eukprot:superscaffoldBa00006500_g21597
MIETYFLSFTSSGPSTSSPKDERSNWTLRLQPISSLRSVLYPGGFQMIHPPPGLSDWLAGSRRGGGAGDVETPPLF